MAASLTLRKTNVNSRRMGVVSTAQTTTGGSAMSRKIRLLPGLIVSATALLYSIIVSASIPPEDEQLDEIVTTGMRVGQGGAQDIKFFRGEAAFERIPHPNDFTAEGLLSEHDIVLPAAEN